jgi:hypothetical protein
VVVLISRNVNGGRTLEALRHPMRVGTMEVERKGCIQNGTGRIAAVEGGKPILSFGWPCHLAIWEKRAKGKKRGKTVPQKGHIKTTMGCQFIPNRDGGWRDVNA